MLNRGRQFDEVPPLITIQPLLNRDVYRQQERRPSQASIVNSEYFTIAQLNPIGIQTQPQLVDESVQATVSSRAYSQAPSRIAIGTQFELPQLTPPHTDRSLPFSLPLLPVVSRPPSMAQAYKANDNDLASSRQANNRSLSVDNSNNMKVEDILSQSFKINDEGNQQESLAQPDPSKKDNEQAGFSLQSIQFDPLRPKTANERLYWVLSDSRHNLGQYLQYLAYDSSKIMQQQQIDIEEPYELLSCLLTMACSRNYEVQLRRNGWTLDLDVEGTSCLELLEKECVKVREQLVKQDKVTSEVAGVYQGVINDTASIVNADHSSHPLKNEEV